MEAVLESIDRDAKQPALDYEGTVSADEVSHETLFGGIGRPLRLAKQKLTANYHRRLMEAVKICERAERTGETGQLREAMQTVDFPLYFGDVLDRQMVGRYQEFTPDWRKIAKVVRVRDFRTVKRFSQDGMEGALNSVGEQKVYPQAVLSEASHTLSVSKYGRTTGFSWEAGINDDEGIFGGIPDRFARAARRTEARAVTALYVGTTGPNTAFYTAGNGNIITANPVLDILGLQTAMTVLGNMRDSDGEPIYIETMILEVPPALATVARNILAATSLTVGGYGQTGGGGVAAQGLMTNNWMRDYVQLVVNPYIPILASSSNGATSWFLHAANTNTKAPFEVGFLRGHELPEIFRKTVNQERIGGGVNMLDGDFEFDTNFLKVRHCLGTAQTSATGGAKLSVASSGAGS